MTPKEILGEKKLIEWFRPSRRKRYRATPLTRALVAGGMLVLVLIFAAVMSGFDDRRRMSYEVTDKISCDNEMEQIKGLALTVYVVSLILLFIGLAVVTDDFFVPSLTVMSDRLNLTEDVAGATLMASGSSAPELFTSLVDAFHNSTSIGVGTIVGSAVFNILVIIACSGAWATESLTIDWRPFSRDVTFYCLSIILLVVLLRWDGQAMGEVHWYEGLIMFLSYGFYVLIMIYNKQLMHLLSKCSKEVPDDCSDIEATKEMVPLKQGECIILSFKLTKKEKSQEIFDAFEPIANEMSVVQSVWYDEDENIMYVNLSNCNRKKDLEESVSKAIVDVCGDGTNASEWVDLSTDKALQPSGGAGGPGAEEEAEESKQWCCLLRIILRILESIVSFLECIVSAIASCWSCFFGLIIPDVNSEDMLEELEMNKDNAELITRIRKKERGYQLSFGLSVLCIAGICYAMVWMAERIGCLIKVHPLFMGLTVLAAGTSIPDALGSIASAQRGMGDMAVANAIGSNVFDILIGLGLPWFLRGVYKKEPFVVEIHDLIIFIAILFGTIFLTLGAFLITSWRLGKTIGWMLLFLYLCFLVFAVLYVYL